MDRTELGQLLNLKVELVPEGRPNRSGRIISANFITMHNTSNPHAGADANAHSRFIREKGFYKLKSGKTNFVSWHYTVDEKMVIKHLPVNERAIHAGKGNGKSIAIEVCMHKGIDQDAANLRAARLVAALSHDLNIPKSNIKPHKHWTGKNCPILLLQQFDEFCDLVHEIRSSLTVSDEGVETEAGFAEVDPLVTEAEHASVVDAREHPAEALDTEGVERGDGGEEHELIAAEIESFASVD